ATMPLPEKRVSGSGVGLAAALLDLFARRRRAGSLSVRIKGPPTVPCSAITVSRVIRVAVVEVVVVGEFFSGSDVANGADEDPAIDFVRFTIWTTRVIDKGGNVVAVNRMFTVSQAKQVGARRVLVNCIGLVV